MFAGRKLLVADDSPYYRTVIGLTFTDEGMEVTTADDGRQALEIIELSAPDVILASVSMPAISGYELCRLIKQSARFAHIPVMLLAGLHEALDHGEAFQAGADDVVTKPFKSIRELVGRVGSLLGGKPAGTESAVGYGHSTLGLGGSEPAEVEQVAGGDRAVTGAQALVNDPSEAEVVDEHNMSDVKVYVEAPLLTEHEPEEPATEPAGSTGAADFDLHTADTQQLQPIDDKPASPAPIGYAQADTLELPAPAELSAAAPAVKPVAHPAESFGATVATTSETGTLEMNEQSTMPTAPLPAPAAFNDGLLDLGDFDSPAPVAAGGDLILDLDFDETVGEAVAPEIIPEAVPEMVMGSMPEADLAGAVTEEPAAEYVPSHEEQHAAELHEWSIVTEEPVVAAPVPAETGRVIESVKPETNGSEMALSPAMIDAIARRAVELMSEKVVREIAWEVVPELAELLIKQKLKD